MNQEKLKKLQEQVRIGGKGSARRKKKVVHQTAATDDKKLQSSLKKLSVNLIPGIEEVNMIRNDGTIIHFNNPKTQASLSANTFAITGHSDVKQITELLPGILHQLGPNGLNQLKKLASNAAVSSKLFGSFTIAEEEEEAAAAAAAARVAAAATAEEDLDDGIPKIIDNFDEISLFDEEYPPEGKTIVKNEIFSQIVEIENNKTENHNSVTLAEIITPVKEQRSLMIATKESKSVQKIADQGNVNAKPKRKPKPKPKNIFESLIEIQSRKPYNDFLLDKLCESKICINPSAKFIAPYDEIKIDNEQDRNSDDSEEGAKITEIYSDIGEDPTMMTNDDDDDVDDDDENNNNKTKNTSVVVTSMMIENETEPSKTIQLLSNDKNDDVNTEKDG